MKKGLILLLAVVLLAVPVSAESYLIQDDAGLLQDHDIVKLEQVYSGYTLTHGFTPIAVTAESFGGLSAEAFAGQYYDIQGYPEDGILLLVSLQEGQWYILTNGECNNRISDAEAERIGEAVVPLLQSQQYYAAFLAFPQEAGEIFLANEPAEDGGSEAVPAVPNKPYGKRIAMGFGAGLLIGLTVVGIMAARMKSVRPQNTASDYIRPGSACVTSSRDIFLYSRVSRTPRPKNNGSSGGGSRGGGSRGGAGGRI